MKGFKFQDEIEKCSAMKAGAGSFGEYESLGHWVGDKARMMRSEDGVPLLYHLPGFLKKKSHVSMMVLGK